MITVGCDVQHDRLELTFLGWAEDGTAFALGHRVIWGQWDDDATWTALDDQLKQTFPHALGGRIGIEAVAVDAGDGTTMHRVTAFCQPRTRRKVMAIKGAPGNRPQIERAGSKTKTGARLWIVGVDTLKTLIFGRLSRGGSIPAFSRSAPRLA